MSDENVIYVDEEVVEEKVNKGKQWFKDNKKVLIAGAICFAAGLIGGRYLATAKALADAAVASPEAAEAIVDAIV